MHLIYFDEVKFDPTTASPYFFLGGILIPEAQAVHLEKTLARIQYQFFQKTYLSHETEIHGKDAYHGKKNFKGRKVGDRLQLFKDILDTLADHGVAARLVRIDVPHHKRKYRYPDPEYRLSLMLFLERVCDYLDEKGDLGIVFGDYEQDEVVVSDFSCLLSKSMI